MLRRLDSLPLRGKIVLILSVVVLFYAVLDGLVQRFVVYESFERLEAREASRDMERVRDAIENEVQHLEVRAWDWATSVEVARFVGGEDRDGAHANLDERTLLRNKLDFLMLCDPSGKVAWYRGSSDSQASDAPAITFRDFPTESLAGTHPLLSRLDAANPLAPASGLLKTEHGPLLVCARWLLDEHGRPPARGYVIIGRLLSSSFVAALAQQTGVDFDVRPVVEALGAAQDREALDAATSSRAPVVTSLDGQTLRTLLTLDDITQAPALLLEARFERAISASGATALRYALFSTVAAGLLMMLALLFLLQRAVLAPIAVLTAHALEIGRSEELTRKLELARKDEIGILSGEFDRMMEKLAQSRAQVVRAARAAGMSEIATGVLHNVGNVLNSVNVSANLLSQQAKRSGAGDLKRVVETIRGSAGDLAQFVASDPRGKHLDPLLEQLAQQLVRENGELERELVSLLHGIDHIKELIHSQQSVAGRAGVLEEVAVRDVIESALALTAPASAGCEPEIVREIQEMPPVPLDRHRLTEILVNLIQNARQALCEPGLSSRRIVVRAARASEHELCIEVEDDGPGIPAENLARIFTHGFTTKKGGHGFGLHASANAATEMGGRLNASSAGPGRGARFVLSLPVKHGRAAAIGDKS